DRAADTGGGGTEACGGRTLFGGAVAGLRTYGARGNVTVRECRNRLFPEAVRCMRCVCRGSDLSRRNVPPRFPPPVHRLIKEPPDTSVSGGSCVYLCGWLFRHSLDFVLDGEELEREHYR